MRALLCRRWGGPETLELSEQAVPTLGSKDVLIQVNASAVNYADLVMIRGRYQTRPQFPFSPGLEACGIVVKCGDDVTKWCPGDRVMALLDYGGFAEMAFAHEELCYAIPEKMDNHTAAAFLIAYVSSHVALRWQARIEKGNSILVQCGGGGGYGSPDERDHDKVIDDLKQEYVSKEYVKKFYPKVKI